MKIAIDSHSHHIFNGQHWRNNDGLRGVRYDLLVCLIHASISRKTTGLHFSEFFFVSPLESFCEVCIQV